MVTKTVFLLAVTLVTVASSTTIQRKPRQITRGRTNDPQTPTVPPGTIEAEMAHCMLEKQTVELDLPEEAGFKFFPTCVRVEQCGGCSMHRLLTCKPTQTETVRYQVRKIPTTENQDGTAGTPYYVNVTRHLACKDQCSLTKQNCTAGKTYDGDKCECICEDIKQKQACDERKDKYWDSDYCTCHCHTEEDCSTGRRFSQDSCTCEEE